MTVADNTSRNQYAATSGQTVFAYTFEIVDKSHIVVLKNGVALSEGTNYSVSNVGNDSGGNVTLTVGATTGDVLTLYRDMPYSRTQNYTNSGDFLASEVNSDFDDLWLAGEQTDRSFSQSIRKPITDSDSISMELPEAATRANKFMKFDANGAVDLAAGVTTDVDADDVSIEDAGGYYTSDNVEGALQEIGAQPPGFDPNTDSFNIGSDAVSSGTDSIALGHDASATAARDIALGYDAVASGGGSIAIGQETDSTGVRSIAVGKGAQSTLSTSIAIGEDASTLNGAGGSPVAIGYSALSTGISGISLGPNTTASGNQSVSIGDSASATGGGSTAIGQNASVTGGLSTALGYGATVTAPTAAIAINDATASGIGSMAIHDNALSSGSYSMAIGYWSQATGSSATAVGYSSQATAESSTALGHGAQATATDSIAIGRQLTTTGTNAIGIGHGAEANNENAIAIGRLADAGYNHTISIGANSAAGNLGSIVIGSSATSDVNNINGVAIGYGATANQSGSVAIGNTARSNSQFGTALGRNSNADSGSYATALGYSSEAATYATAVGSNADATGANSTAVGYGSNASNNGTVALGNSAQALNLQAISIGQNASSGGSSNIAIGNAPTTTGVSSIAIGTSANASDSFSIAIGADSEATVTGSIAVGKSASATGLGVPIAIGRDTESSGAYGISMGEAAVASGAQTLAIGYGAEANNDNGIAIGRQLTVAGQKAIGIGWGAVAGSGDSIGIGTSANALNTYSISIGVTSQSLASGGVAIGGGAITSATNINGVAIGYSAQANSIGGVAIGNNARVSNTSSFGTAIGRDSLADNGDYSTALGYGSSAYSYATALGSNSDATGSNSTAVGYGADSLGNDAIALGYLAGADADNTIHINASGVNTNQPQTAGYIVIETDDASLTYDGTWSLAGGALSTDGLDVTGDVTFGDNDKAIFGAGSDLQIYHDGYNSFIDDTGTGSLVLQSNGAFTVIQNSSGVANARFDSAGAASIRYNGVEKLATTLTGIDVTGTATISEDLLLGSNGRLRVGSTGSLATPTIYLDTDTNTGIYFPSTDSIGVVAGGAEKLTVNSTGIDVTGTATMDGLTVGDSSSAFTLAVLQSSTTGESELRMGDTDTDAGSISYTNSDDTMTFRAAAGARMSLDSSGLDVQGNAVLNNGYRFQVGGSSTGDSYIGDLRNTAGVLTLRTEGARNMAFDTNGAERLRISSTGLVGIGTDDPTSNYGKALHIHNTATGSSLHLTDGTSGSGASDGTDFIHYGNDSYIINRESLGTMRFFTASSEAMRIKSDGKVGIGTTSPASISGGTASQGTLTLGSLDGAVLVDDVVGALSFSTFDASYTGTYSDGITGEIASVSESAVGGAYGLSFYTGTTTGSNRDERLRISATGLVGIGTSNPASALEISDSGVELRITDSRNGSFTTGDTVSSLGFYSDDTSGGSGGNTGLARGVIDVVSENAFGSSHAMAFKTRGDVTTAAAEAMRITSSGLVGLGTTLPSGKLHLSGDGDTASKLTVQRTGATTGTTVLGYDYVGSFSNNDFAVYANSTEAMRIDSSGNVGIGTNSPSSFNQVGTAPLMVIGTGSNSPSLTLYGGTSSSCSLAFADGTTTADQYRGLIQYTHATDSLVFVSDATEAMRIDSSQNLLVNRTSAFTTAKVEIQSDSGDASTLALNSINTDGDILEFYKSGNSVGSIGTEGGDLYIGTGNTKLRFDDANDAIYPGGGDGSGTDNNTDLGKSDERFKDLYLSGGVVFGTTGGAVTGATLDDYEEGTWTPEVVGSSTAGSYSNIARSGTYTKVGNVVTVWMLFYGDSGTGTGSLNITGLPFAAVANRSGISVLQYNSGLDIPTGHNTPCVMTNANATSAQVRCNSDSTGSYAAMGYPTTAGYLRFTLTYETTA